MRGRGEKWQSRRAPLYPAAAGRTEDTGDNARQGLKNRDSAKIKSIERKSDSLAPHSRCLTPSPAHPGRMPQKILPFGKYLVWGRRRLGGWELGFQSEGLCIWLLEIPKCKFISLPAHCAVKPAPGKSYSCSFRCSIDSFSHTTGQCKIIKPTR